jgi:CDP-diacylglycerol--glycerol-3-phosphate 3-phosphatidyltransferase
MVSGDAFWTISNGFSLARMVLVLPTLWLLKLGPDHRWTVFWLVVVMAATDVLDGYLARRRGEVTRWGKILDPVADKLAIDSIAIALVFLKGLPVWVAAAIVGRDILIVAGGLFLMSRVRIVTSSNVWGKLASIVMSCLLLAYAMDAEVLKWPLLAMTALLLVASSVSYGIRFLRRIRPS